MHDVLLVHDIDLRILRIVLSRVHKYLCRITMSGKVSDLPILYTRAVFTQKKLDRINIRSGNGGRILRNPPGVTRC